MGHTANNCFQCQNRNTPHVDNLTKVEEITTEILKDIQTTDQILDTGLPILFSIG